MESVMGESVVRNLLRTAKLLRLRMEEALAEAGGSFATFVILDAITIEEGLSQRGLATRLSIEGPSITRHLDHLEAEGLVTRRRDPNDRRVIRVYPTAAGAARYQALCPIVTQREQWLFAGTPPADLATLSRLLDQTRERLLGFDDN